MSSLFDQLSPRYQRNPHQTAEYLGGDQWRILDTIFTGSVSTVGGEKPMEGRTYNAFCKDPDSWRNWIVFVESESRSRFVPSFPSLVSWFNPIEGDESGRGHSRLVTPGVVPAIDGTTTTLLDTGLIHSAWAQFGIYDSNKIFILSPAANLADGVHFKIFNLETSTLTYDSEISDPALNSGYTRVWWVDDLRLFMFAAWNIIDLYDENMTFLSRSAFATAYDLSLWIKCVGADGSIYRGGNEVIRYQIVDESPYIVEQVEVAIAANEDGREYEILGRKPDGTPVVRYRVEDTTDKEWTRLGVITPAEEIRVKNYDWTPYHGASAGQDVMGEPEMSALILPSGVVGAEVESHYNSAFDALMGFASSSPGNKKSGLCDEVGILWNEGGSEVDKTWAPALERYLYDSEIGYYVADTLNVRTSLLSREGTNIAPGVLNSPRWGCASGFFETAPKKAPPKEDLLQLWWLPPGMQSSTVVNYRFSHRDFNFSPRFQSTNWRKYGTSEGFSGIGNVSSDPPPPRDLKYEFRDSGLNLLYAIDTGPLPTPTYTEIVYNDHYEPNPDKVTICDDGQQGWMIIDALASGAVAEYRGRRILVTWTKSGSSISFNHEVAEETSLGHLYPGSTQVLYPQHRIAKGDAILQLFFHGGTWKLDRYQ